MGRKRTGIATTLHAQGMIVGLKNGSRTVNLQAMSGTQKFVMI